MWLDWFEVMKPQGDHKHVTWWHMQNYKRVMGNGLALPIREGKFGIKVEIIRFYYEIELFKLFGVI